MLTGKTISQLDLLSNITDDTSIPVELSGNTYHVQYSSMKPYKVYTALLTQSGGDELMMLYVGPSYGNNLTIGVSYTIVDNGVTADFRNVGAPNNNIGTSFVATGEIPLDRGDDNTYLSYNVGTPTVTVLENTIGNIWFGYEGPTVYYILSNDLFTPNKTWFMGSAAPDPTTGLNQPIAVNFNASTQPSSLSLSVNGGNYPGGNVLNLTPIEIRVYN